MLRHGYRLEWVGTPRLPWGDAVTILLQQPPAQSALYREIHPDEYDRSRESQILEILAVLLAQMQLLVGNQSRVPVGKLPAKFSDLLAPVATSTSYFTEEQILADMAAFDKRIGRG